MIQAKILADSKNEFGNRITTMIVTFPRYILAEFNTHRMFSRNSASSRAIPFEKLLKSVEENPFIPIAWMKDHKGMQGTEFFTDVTEITIRKNSWKDTRYKAIQESRRLADLGVTKQICNRILEPYMWHTVIVTATEWENFFALRCPLYRLQCAGGEVRHFRSKKEAIKRDDTDSLDFKTATIIDWLKINIGQADIHMMALAEAMWDAYNESIPKELKAGEWHIPFGDDIKHFNMLSNVDRNAESYSQELIDQIKIKIATARCARVSYTVVGEEEKAVNYNNDIKLHDRLAASGHWSPFEHCAQTMNEEQYDYNRLSYGMNDFGEFGENVNTKSGVSGNFRGFIQYRKTFANENITQ